MNSIGRHYRITLIGSSHGNMVGVVIDGIRPGVEIDTDAIKLALRRRRPGQSKITTDREEEDNLIIETGILGNHTTGEPLVAFVRNKDTDSSYYDEIKNTPRPGHADYPASVKYKGAQDHRGGGRFSGRMTVGLVIAGEIASQILKNRGVTISSYTKSISNIVGLTKNTEEGFIFSEANIIRTADPDKLDEMISFIMKLKKEGDSCGGIIETIIEGLEVGVGEPWFDSIESKISHMIFSIPAVKGIEFGSGFGSTRMRGSEHNDPFFYEGDEIKTSSNNAGGILGGLSNGMPVVFRTAFKPTSSIAKEQKTVDLESGETTELKIRGRHDPCIVPRAVPVVSAAASCVVLDLMMQGGFI